MTYADVHTHILPAIDDGSKGVEMSIEMLSLLEDSGVTDVILTPHFYFWNQSISTFLEKREKAFKALVGAYKGKIRLHLGAEVEFSDISIDYREFSKLAIDNGKYILLELPFKKDFSAAFFKKLDSFIYQTGLIPIIAHIERYSAVLKHPELIAELIDMGCLIQLNAETVINTKKGSFADALIRHGQIHLIGSDCHNLELRKPNYHSAISFIEENYGIENKNHILTISDFVASGKEFTPFNTSRIRKWFGKYR